MSKRAINPNQLRMFMTADEITRMYQPLEGDRQGTYNEVPLSQGGKAMEKWQPETDEQVWERKAEEAGEEYLYGDIEEHGVKRPVHLGTQMGKSGKPQVVGGHHRIAVMKEVAPDELMPVLHHENFQQAWGQARFNRGKGFPYT